MATAIYTAARMSLLLMGWAVAYAISLLLEDVWPAAARLFVMTAVGAWWTLICVVIVRREAQRAMPSPEQF